MSLLSLYLIASLLLFSGNFVCGRRTELISSNPGFTVDWEIADETSRNATISFNLTVETTGFVGFGISKNGAMGGADIVIGGVFPNGTAYFSDRHAPSNGFPPEDISQDWIIHSATENMTHTHLHISRLLDTCDQDDVAITKDTFRFIWSVGSDDNIAYHGVNNRGSFAVNILGLPYPDIDLSTFSIFDAVTNLTMPSQDTTYWCTVHKAPVFSGKQHAVAFGPVLFGPVSEKHSHHISLYSCTPPNGEDPEEFFNKYIVQGGIDCLNPNPGEISAYRYCTKLIYTWTIGGRIMHMPDGVGFPIGEETHMYYLMESHFDNPEQLVDVSFQSGVRIYYTPELRPIEAGVMRTGQMYDYNLVVPPTSKDYVVVGHCSSNCTAQWIPAEGVNIFNIMLHSHSYGTKMKLRQFRDGAEEPWVLNDDNYDNDYQDNRNIPLVKFLPGDQMAIECNYDTSMLSPPTGVLGGFGTRREMCEAVYYYYPKIGLENCRSSILKENIRNFFGISVRELNDALTNPVITAPEHLAGLSFLDYVDSIVWNDVTRGELERLMRFSLHTEQCGGDGFQKGSPDASRETYYVTYPDLGEEYVPPNSECPSKF